MREAWIIDGVRTPIGRHGGSLAPVRADDLAAVTIEALLRRTGVEAGAVDDVLFGCTNQAGEDNRNVARMALLRAGLPVGVPGQTVNRLCGSGMQALLSAFHAIAADEGDVFIAGGVESMSRAPYVMLKPSVGYARGTPEIADTVLGWRFPNPAFAPEWTIGLGETAEVVAEEYGVSREAQDAFAAESQRRAGAAIECGRFDDEIVPVGIPQRRGDPVVVDADEHPRSDTTLAALARLAPAFRKGGTVTAGNSSGINDGAAALLVVSDERARALGLEPMARVVAGAVAGVEPHRMGIGPVPATQRALRRRISCTSVTTMRAPEQPTGCPSAIAPPFTLTLAGSRPSSLMQGRAWAANASFSSTRSGSLADHAARRSARCVAGTGPMPMR